jgi:hypothetical protein
VVCPLIAAIGERRQVQDMKYPVLRPLWNRQRAPQAVSPEGPALRLHARLNTHFIRSRIIPENARYVTAQRGIKITAPNNKYLVFIFYLFFLFQTC